MLQANNRVFANGPGDLGSILGHIISKTLKMVLDTSLINTHQYKVRIKGKVKQYRERSSALFTNGPEDQGSIPGCLIPKTLKMVLDTSLLNTQQYTICIKGKVEQYRERSSALPYTLV